MSLFSVSSSLISPSTSSLLPAVPTNPEPRDSQHSVDEVAAGASELPGGVAGLVAPEVTVAVAPGPSEDLAPASLEVALVAPSSPQPASPSPSLASGGPSISGDVVQQFDATHRLSELTAAWGSLSTLASSFGEKLQVGFIATSFCVFVSLLSLRLVSLCLFLLSLSLAIILASSSHLRMRGSCLRRWTL